MHDPISLALVGAGNRGIGYARWARRHPDRARVVAVAEPVESRRAVAATEHDIPPEHTFASWGDLAARPRLADAVIVATQDGAHRAPATAFAEAGYHVLLEKPIAPTESECRAIAEAALRHPEAIFAVCHVLRYTPYTRLVKRVLDEGRVGEIVSIQHLEPVGYWHQAHSYVRGNWRREDEASSMLLAKSCHDLDWLEFVVGAPIERVSSFGGLKHFTPANRPAGAADRCLDCAVEADCAFSARKIYLGRVDRGVTGWPLTVLTEHPTRESVTAALRSGPYGRCVYACDNDVVDHQVVSMTFGGGATGTFTMTGFNAGGHRRTRIFGTRGELIGDGEHVEVVDFLTDERTRLDVADLADPTAGGGHGGGDDGLMDAFVRAVGTGDRRHVLSGPRESLSSHLAVFAAETARREGTVVTVVR